MKLAKVLLFSFLLMLGACRPAVASQAYGSINNFDCVNDTGVETHGFEIEIDYGRTTDITYTYDTNHYGIPKIREDLTDPAHPIVYVRYAGVRNPDGTWTAYTAIPAGPISPTMGHQFTNPAVNFGGEHFGLGFIGTPAAVKYNWLIDDGAGNLVHGPAVYISTPSFTYVPPAGGAAGNVQAAIVLPPPPVQPPLQFGAASWVKEIKTTTHNPTKIPLNALVGDDPGKPQPWANGEPAEVEMEWKIMQTQFAAAGGGKNGELKGAPEDLPGGNEVITRRYEFYKYVGPFDAETGEAMGDTVAADGIHGVGTVTYADHYDPATGEWVTKTVDLSTVVVVGDYVGAQMAGFDLAPNLGLIDHIQDGDANVAFPARTVVVAGQTAFQANILSGSLPPGMKLDPLSGILSGTPTAGGTFTFTVQATDLGGANISKSYTVTISGAAAQSFTITTSAFPTAGGSTSGGGTVNAGTSVTVNATANAAYAFVNWTENGNQVSTNASYTFTATADRTLVANFAAVYTVSLTASPTSGGTVSGGGSFNSGTSATAVATAKSGYGFVNWTDGSTVLSTSPSYTFTVISNRALVANFGQLVAISTSALPAADGSVTGGGNLAIGSTATLQATAKAGFGFVNWTEAGKVVSTSATYSFKVTAKRTLVANFAKFFSVSVSATPLAGGTVTGAGNFKTGTSVTVQATVNVGYAFVNWTEGGKVVCSTASYKFNATANRNLVANFIQTFTVTTSASPANEGTTSGGGAFKSGNSATVKATAKAGFKFVNWTEGQTVASSAASYKFTVTANRTLVANFAKK